tara:strand:- start:6 stop:449 length:444 start_codon:yes stop_codon:yes gene_type:complete
MLPLEDMIDWRCPCASPPPLGETELFRRRFAVSGDMLLRLPIMLTPDLDLERPREEGVAKALFWERGEFSEMRKLFGVLGWWGVWGEERRSKEVPRRVPRRPPSFPPPPPPDGVCGVPLSNRDERRPEGVIKSLLVAVPRLEFELVG